MGGDELSNEILLEIFKSLDRDDLRSMRLVCKRTRDVANALLFANVHVDPSMDSIEIFQEIAHHPELARCVQVIDCDGDTHKPGQTTDDAYKRIDQIRSWVKFERHAIPLARFQSFFLNFEHLRAVTFRGGREKHIWDGEIRGLDIIGALPFDKITEFTALNIDVNRFFTRERQEEQRLETIRTLKFRLSSLRTLRLDFNVCFFDLTGEPTALLVDFSTALAQAENIQNLHLGFETPVGFQCPRNWLQMLKKAWPSLLGRKYNDLRRLSLYGVVITEDTLIEYVNAHRETLTSLTLNKLCLTSDVTPDEASTNTVSGVRALWRLREASNLSEVHLLGFFTDLRHQWWTIEDVDSPGSIRQQVEDFLCHRGAFPFQGLEDMAAETILDALSNEPRDRDYLGSWIEQWHQNLSHVSDVSWKSDTTFLSAWRKHLLE